MHDFKDVKGRQPIRQDRDSITPTRNDCNKNPYKYIPEKFDTSNSDYETESSLNQSRVSNSPKPKSKIPTNEKTKEKPNLLPDLKVQRVDTGSQKWYIILAVVCLACYVGITTNTKEKHTVEKQCSFSDLEQKHLQQDKYVWQSLSTGIENIINQRSDTIGVYLFLHNGSSYAKQLILDIAQKSSSCFDYERSPVEMVKSDFTSEKAIVDYGYVIEKYKIKVKEGSVIIILDLNEIPADTARALHVICDTHSPIVKNVVIFLTLITQESSDNPTESAENALFQMWGSKIERSDLDPLITRVTDEVIALKS